jgi:hypothetical protein
MFRDEGRVYTSCFALSKGEVRGILCSRKGGDGMLGVKEQVILMIQTLPDNITLEDVMEELYFKLQVDAGIKELNEGKGLSHKEVEKRMSRWLTK